LFDEQGVLVAPSPSPYFFPSPLIVNDLPVGLYIIGLGLDDDGEDPPYAIVPDAPTIGGFCFAEVSEPGTPVLLALGGAMLAACRNRFGSACRLSFRMRLAALLMVGCLLPAVAAASPVVGQVDTFEDGTTQGWVINLLGLGSPPPAVLPTNIPTGGPGGGDDNFLHLTSVGGSGAGSRLVAINLDPRWSGNYVAAGVNAITMHVNNLGSTELSLRILLERGGPPTDVAFSTVPVVVFPGSGWTSVIFPIDSSSLTAAIGTVNAALSDATLVRIFHSPTPEFPGPAVVAQLGVDNIAAAVPEPPSAMLLVTGLSVVGMLAHGCKRKDDRRRRRKLDRCGRFSTHGHEEPRASAARAR
jgi:hypothetical protein